MRNRNSHPHSHKPKKRQPALTPQQAYAQSGQGPWQSLWLGLCAVSRRALRILIVLGFLLAVALSWVFVLLSFYVENARRHTPRSSEHQWDRWKRDYWKDKN